jgi:hypothetical protein
VLRIARNSSIFWTPLPDMCAKKFLLVSIGGREEGLACADPGTRTPNGASVNFHNHVMFRTTESVKEGVQMTFQTSRLNASFAIQL